jgi:hypothetical protein
MRVRIFPGQENQVCLSASGTGRIGRQWLCMVVSLADSQETAGSASQNQYSMPGIIFFEVNWLHWAGPSNNEFTSSKDPLGGWGNLF